MSLEVTIVLAIIHLLYFAKVSFTVYVGRKNWYEF